MTAGNGYLAGRVARGVILEMLADLPENVTLPLPWSVRLCQFALLPRESVVDKAQRIVAELGDLSGELCFKLTVRDLVDTDFAGSG